MDHLYALVAPFSPAPLSFSTIARLPAPGDNVAIATRQLDAGTTIDLPGAGPRTLAHTVLLGHRFAARPIAKGDGLLSWELPFGRALRDIAPGEYVCNAITVEALAGRELPGVMLPREPNFEEAQYDYRFDEATFRPATQVSPVAAPIAAPVPALPTVTPAPLASPPNGVYSPETPGVTPPVLTRPQMPREPAPGEDTGYFEIIVDEKGLPEQVKLISPRRRYHDRMLVAAALH